MKKITIMAFLLAFVLAFGACEEPQNNAPVLRNPEGTISYLFPSYEGFYYEAPSVLTEENRLVVSYTTNATEGAEDSVIAVRTAAKSGSAWDFSAEPSVAVAPSADGWDKYNVGNGDIVAGSFTYRETDYAYLMAYEASPAAAEKRFSVGLAVSSDLKNWEKVGNAPFLSYDYETYGDTAGICYPSLVNLNGKGNILLFYTYASSTVTETRFVEANLSDLDHPAVSGSISVAHEGLPLDGNEWAVVTNADFAYDAETDEIFIVKDGFPYAAQNAQKATKVEIAKIALESLYAQTARWTPVCSIVDEFVAGGYSRIYSAAFVSDACAWIAGEEVSIAFTSGVAQKNAEDKTWIHSPGIHLLSIEAALRED